MISNKNHWYDGWFYDKLIAPNQDNLFRIIKEIIKEGSDVLDVGCGTGRLLFQLADKCNGVTGIDLSLKNIYKAKENLVKNPVKNIQIIHGNALELQNKINKKFDYSILTYVIHEMHFKERIEVINQLKKISNKIIIGDYLVPHPKSFYGKLNWAVEFAAGRDHFNNFKNFLENGGLKELAKNVSMKIEKEILNVPKTMHVVVLSK